jgi:putative aldouronate transport system permease protein
MVVATVDRDKREARAARGHRAFRIVNAIVLAGVVVLTLYPFVNVVARSFSGRLYIAAGQVNLWPKGFNTYAYRGAFADPMFWHSYRNTLVYSVVSTAIAMVLTTCYAYVLSKKRLRGRVFLVGIAVVTMFFDGGMIPNYVLVSRLGLRNTIWAIALPNAINIFNLLVMKAFFESLPDELEEAAAIDGMGTYRILLRIVLPLSKPVIATMSLFYAVYFWNSWFTAFLYLDRQSLYPVTVYLRNVITDAGSNVQATASVLTALPIVLIFPFIQRYFVSGVMLGTVKG